MRAAAAFAVNAAIKSKAVLWISAASTEQMDHGWTAIRQVREGLRTLWLTRPAAFVHHRTGANTH
ncbi:hypothetical protein PFY01_00135 [Brevundimonas vesicularis]|uniref:hypothetical protein n=1 Tax=Brevundimonas vesicularis TaxID=41276 RepID=UPI0022EC59B5|nr:hypothetical protein [Brevundimonas vesicularis]WBT06127.1 hypothetical protein PFY01_00135 [Brevundimonas vesicularis]